MGQSTDAILFYGYCWDEEAANPWEDPDVDEDVDEDDADSDWEDRYARAKGCLPPSEPYPNRTVTGTQKNGWDTTPKDYSAKEQTLVKQYNAYWEKKSELAAKATCCVDSHCSGECTRPYVAVTAPVTKAHRGYMKEITSLTIDPSWNAELAAFCKIMGIQTEGKKAAWWLVSDWT